MARKPEAEVVPITRFRRGAAAEVIPEISAAPPPEVEQVGTVVASKPAVDLSGRQKVWCLLSSNGGGKTTYARWMKERADEQGHEAPLLAALDPADRSLASWFDYVDQPPTRDTRGVARWLRDYLDHIEASQANAILDFGGGGEGAMSNVFAASPEVLTMKPAIVACYPLTPRVTDIFVLRDMENAGFKPEATLLLLNEGRADPTRPVGEAFEAIMRHSVFRRAVARGAQIVWMPALDSEVVEEIETKHLPFGAARDGLVPEGATFNPIGGLRRSAVGRFLALMEQRHEGNLKTWLP